MKDTSADKEIHNKEEETITEETIEEIEVEVTEEIEEITEEEVQKTSKERKVTQIPIRIRTRTTKENNMVIPEEEDNRESLQLKSDI